MKLNFLSLALLLASNGAYAIEKYNCFGTEPFWSLELSDEGADFSSMDGENVIFKAKYGAPEGSTDAYVLTVQGTAESKAEQEAPVQLVAFISNLSSFTDGRQSVKPYCSDGMSDRNYPFSINMLVDGRALTGCCYTKSSPATEN